MPTQLARTQITHTPQVQRAIDVARERWSDDSDGKLLLHLIEEGERSVRDDRRMETEQRRAELERMSARYRGVFTESLDSIREGWPE
ncbi:hypothetical protein [Leifsonia shinshuensis]|uniref:hypothetical protein n=1 Tax=Leifsonia shinshuensis TaxID=150026 RepID=UPI002862DE35|nr:hypothetical protein [Leifsonia shinshuensis]MDR6970854.1 hypothetical protein [Leifsonia shinshuensis]